MGSSGCWYPFFAEMGGRSSIHDNERISKTPTPKIGPYHNRMMVITFRLFGGWNNRSPHIIVKMLTGLKDLARVPKFWGSIFLSGSFWRRVRRLGKLLCESFVWHPPHLQGNPFRVRLFQTVVLKHFLSGLNPKP